ncbi:MAG: hypothetical protein QOE45_413 [Frankiaceae bacterium]|jgi:hypothetical protein|nr:hypothetical protein [Frankiaceae bacterium]
MTGRALPEQAVAAMRDAFAGEVATRLPGMQSAACEILASGAIPAARTLSSHAHTLASSAAVLGELVVSLHARHCEALLVPFCADGGGSVPRSVAADCAYDVEAMALLLAPWLGGTS